MSDDNESIENADALNEESKVETVSAEDQLKAVQKKLADTEGLLAKARKGETDNRNARKALETRVAEMEGDEYKTKYEQVAQEFEQLKGTLKLKAIEGAITDVAKANGAKDIKAVLKLVDTSAIEVVDGVADAKAVEDAITKTREEFSVLFEAPKTPAVKRPGEGNATDTFKNELTAARTKEEKLAVMKKYGIGTTI